jgi:hypothetical protein
VDRLKSILQAKGVTLSALIDHSGEAEKVGMTMRPTKLLVFGAPKASTPLMLAAPSIAIDLPLKFLVWEDNQGRVWISYNSPEYLKERQPCASGLGSESRGRRDGCGQGRGVMMLSHRMRARGVEPTTNHRMCGLLR